MMAIVAFVSYHFEIKRIEKEVIENLNLNHELRISSITGNLLALKEEVGLLAQNERVIELMKNQKVNRIINNEHIKWGAQIVSHFGFHDLILIRENGDIIFSIAKEKDLGTNLNNGLFAKSGLGDLYREVVETKEFGVVDFAIYKPSNNRLAAFVGAPIFAGDKMIGVLSIQLPSSFEKPTIGVPLRGIENYIITTRYFFDRQMKFNSIDRLGFKIPKESTVMMQDSLHLFTPFKVGHLDWGILSVAPPTVFKHFIRWWKIWYHLVVAFLISQMILVLILKEIKKRRKALIYEENEAIIVQNTWLQFNNKKHAFGTDFYYRIKNKTNIDIRLPKQTVDNIGSLIEQNTDELIGLLLNQNKLQNKLVGIAKSCYENNISVAQILKMPALFLESYEDELGRTIPIRANIAWRKVLKSISLKLVQQLKNTKKA
ncbi:MAG: hypothetical protein L3J06_04285 [Cyclobacteriaceae bacterium]|nr:hypothetical protein [Cyclobacteriaceae bacterium]